MAGMMNQLSDPDIYIWLMTSNSILKTQKKLRDIVYHYYKCLCIQFARPTWCWNVVDERG